MRKIRIVAWWMTVVFMLSVCIACGETPQDVPAPVAVTSLAEAKAAIDDGHYEAAYRYLLTDTTEEATEMRRRFRYVPVEATHAQDGEVYATIRWVYDDGGLPIGQTLEADIPSQSATVAVDAVHECTYNERGDLLTHITVSKVGEKEKRTEERYIYDARGNVLTEEHSSSDGTWSKSVYTYDDADQCLTAEHTGSDKSGQKYVFTYDDAGNLLAYEIIGEKGTTRFVHTYDENGNRLTRDVTNADGSWSKIVNTYDAHGETTAEETNSSDGKWEKWYMDGDKKVTETRSPDGGYTKTVYREEDCLYSYSLRNDEGVQWIESEQTGDEAGNILLKRQWSGNHTDVTGQGSGTFTRFTYDEHGNLLKEENGFYSDYHDLDGSAHSVQIAESYTYQYDADGRMTEKVGIEGRYSGRVFTYTYDALGRIATEEYRDEDGSWWRSVFRYRDNEDVTGTSSWEYDHLDGNYLKLTLDENGRVATQEQADNGQVTKTELTYDADGKVLTQTVTKPDGSWHRLSYDYDENNRKVREENAYSDGRWTKETYDVAGHLLTRETDDGTTENYRWELKYYADDVSQTAQENLDGCNRVMDDFEEQLYSYDWN